MRQIVLRKLPDGRIRVHLFVHDEDVAPITTPAGTVQTVVGPVTMGGSKGYIACNPQRKSILPVKNARGLIEPCVHTNDVRAATCPECCATEEYKAMMKILGEIDDTAVQGV